MVGFTRQQLRGTRHLNLPQVQKFGMLGTSDAATDSRDSIGMKLSSRRRETSTSDSTAEPGESKTTRPSTADWLPDILL